MWSRCGLGECGTACVSPVVDGGLASRDVVTLQIHDDSCLCHVRKGILIPRNWQLRNTVIHRATCSQACCKVRNKVCGTCSRRMSEAPSSRCGVRFICCFISPSPSLLIWGLNQGRLFTNKSLRQSLYDSVYYSILLKLNFCSLNSHSQVWKLLNSAIYKTSICKIIFEFMLCWHFRIAYMYTIATTLTDNRLRGLIFLDVTHTLHYDWYPF